MPYLRFSGFDKQMLQEISSVLIHKFSEIAVVPKEKVKIERLLIEPIANSPASVEILMFPREQEKHDAIARMIHQLLEQNGYPNAHIFFVLLQRNLYYKEGVPLESDSRIESRPVLNAI